MKLEGHILRVEDGWVNLCDLETGELLQTFPDKYLPKDISERCSLLSSLIRESEDAINGLIEKLTKGGYESGK